MFATIEREFPDVPQIDPAAYDSLSAAEGDRLVLLDARSPAEYAVSHISGAQRAETLDAALAIMAEHGLDTPVVVYCSVGYRSARLVGALRARGYAQSANLRGSIFVWANEGRPLVQDGRIVRSVHPYSGFWGRLLRRDLHAWKP